MNKIFFIYMFLATSPLILKGQNCEYKTNEIDKFLKVKRIETEPVRFYNMWHGVDISLKKIDGKKYLVVYLKLYEFKPLCFKEKSSAYFLSTKDSVVQLQLDPTQYLECGNTYIVANMKYSDYTLHYSLGEEEIAKLKEFEIASMRFYATNTYIEFEKLKGPLKKEKIKNFFSSSFRCIE